MREGFQLQTEVGAGGIGIGGPPGWVGGQVAPPSSHLIDSPGDELAQSHEGPRSQGGSVVLVPWGWEEAGPLVQEGFSHPLLEGGIGIFHQRLRREGGGRETRGELITGIFESPWVKGTVLWATASTGRWAVIGGMGRGVFQCK